MKMVLSQSKLVLPDGVWKHDLWNQTPPVKSTNIQPKKPITSEAKCPGLVPVSMPKPVALVPKINLSNPNIRRILSQQNSNVPRKVEPKQNTVSQLWLSDSVDSQQQSVFKRLGNKVNESATKSKPNINVRLIVKPTHEPVAQVPVAKQTDTVDFMTMKSQPVQPANDIDAIAEKISKSNLDGLDKKNPKVALILACKQRGCDPPKYYTVQSQFKKFEGLVTVDGITFSTLPFDYAKESDAEDAAASVALSNIKDRPESQESDEEIAQKIFDCIADNGIFLKYLPNIFEQKYDTSLPTGWQFIIQNRPQMFSIGGRDPYEIIFKQSPNSKAQPVIEPVVGPQSMISNENPLPQQSESPEVGKMELPWHDATWKIDVTWVASTVGVWGQLSDSKYLDNLNRDFEKIEQKLSRGIHPEISETVIVGGIYLTAHETAEDSNHPTVTVYRIQVKKFDNEKKSALCFYIDDGFEEWLSLLDSSDLKFYQIPRELMQIPPQAIQFSLFNLEDFAENSVAQGEVVRCLSDKQFLAKIKSTKEQYEAQLEANSIAKVNVMLFDVSKEEDVNMNKEILGNICAKLRPPQLEQNQSTVVHVTHVADIGNIYCRLHNSKEMQHIKQLIHRLTHNGINEAFRVDTNELHDGTSKALRLIFDTTDNRWYRAISNAISNATKEFGTLPIGGLWPYQICRI
ncbi:uncharacterized protein LOC129580537 [Sitodiplosis mosellana]|uniref:uncharacterized protein LOC129580537 n=1 Tax=Sitodiplosis mosellana TaxID=263140 RepID=UPI002443A94F|nr:uncharacterized protein LOC129580537 [Sitodiplosis mosellana]